MFFDEWNDPKWEAMASVSRPSRYTGGEWGNITPKDDPNFRLCLCFPDVYEVGMSYLGYQILYPFIKALPGMDVERAYCPWTDMEQKMRSLSLPLGSIETSRPLSRFDSVGFTLQYELSFTNILTMLDLGGIPLRSRDRSKDDPLVMAGGPGAMTPEPLSDFIDLFCMGDGEAVLPELLGLLSDTKGMDRGERLEMASHIEGVYVPSMGFPGKPIKKVVLSDMDSFCPSTAIVPSASILHDRIAVEIFRGCSRGCRFCQAGMLYRPVRERSPEKILEAVKALSDYTGWEEVSLVSLASCDYSRIESVIGALKAFLEERDMKLSLPSLRMDNFALSLASSLDAMKKSGLTLAPEGGTQRIRDVINKGVTEEHISRSFKAALDHGWERIKLYFMMGLPTETEKDLDGIVEMGEMGLSMAKSLKKRLQINISVAGFVPKAHTPFQWDPQDSMETLREKGKALKSRVRSRKISLKYHEPSQTFLEGVMARGDRKLGEVIERAWKKGARFDGWTETFNLGFWLESMEEIGLDPRQYANREREKDEVFPWDMIDPGVTRDFLWRERVKSKRGEITPDCREGLCSGCGWQKKGCKWAGGGNSNA